jgi:hypothetical protein
MQSDLRQFWHRFQDGIEVAVAGSSADSLLGVRDGFLRYFRHGLERPVPVAVVTQPAGEERGGLFLSDEATLEYASEEVRRLAENLGDSYHFYVGSQGGLHAVEISGRTHYFVRCWTVIRGAVGEASGASGSVEIPPRLIDGLDDSQIPFAVPGTRRRGGMISSLTGSLETRRSAVAVSTFHAISTLFYGILESRPVVRR